MRVALVQCPPWGSLPPLGLASLKPFLEQHGHEVRCFDLNIEYCRDRLREVVDDVGGSVYARPDPWASGSYDDWDFEFDGEVHFTSTLKERPLPIERWVDQILGFRPEVVGFSNQATNLGVTLQVAQRIRLVAPDVTVVFGGPNVAEAQQGVMALETRIPHLVVEGEGEETLIEVLGALGSDGDLSEVAGIGRLVDGVPTWTPRRPLLGDVDALPFPDFSDFDWSMYPNPYEIPIMTSRGCVLNCAFCYETVYWKRFRTQSSERIVAEIEHQITNHPLRPDVLEGRARFGMSFADSLVNGHLGGLKRMAELLIERKVDIYWNGQATINAKMDDDFFQKLGASGCTGLSFGLESGSPRVLESMGKKFDIDEAADFFERVQRSGIELVVNVMVGFPTETRADFVETLRFLTRIRRMIYMVNNVGSTAVVGGSRIHQDPERFGITPADMDAWTSRRDLRWVTKAAGTERSRQLRVKVLHAWMTLMRIPHQRIGPTAERSFGLKRRAATLEPGRATGVVVPRSRVRRQARAARAQAVGSGAGTAAAQQVPRPITRPQVRIKRLARSLGEEPLVVQVAQGVVEEVAAAPAWAEPLAVGAWIGLEVDELRQRLAAFLGGDVELVERPERDGQLEVSLTVVDPPGGGLEGVRLWVMPTSTGGATLTLAIFPLRSASSSVAAS
jgi:hypothetical protein